MDLSSLMNAVLIVVGGGAGGATTVTFLSKYLGDRWLGHVLEKEKAAYQKQLAALTAEFRRELEHYKAQLDRSIFVSRTHFETEFTAMKDVSQRLSEVKVCFLRLHPKDAREKLTDAERSQEIDLMEKAVVQFHEKLQEWAVFLEVEQYNEFDHCYAGAHKELKRLKGKIEHEEDRAHTVAYFWDSYRKASQLVRDRIKSLAVLPRT